MGSECNRVLHCWADRASWIADTHGFHSDEHIATYPEMSATCLLEAGHDGPHEWTPDDEILVSFPVDERKADGE